MDSTVKRKEELNDYPHNITILHIHSSTPFKYIQALTKNKEENPTNHKENAPKRTPKLCNFHCFWTVSLSTD